MQRRDRAYLRFGKQVGRERAKVAIAGGVVVQASGIWLTVQEVGV
jgi:hypothetical protein